MARAGRSGPVCVAAVGLQARGTPGCLVVHQVDNVGQVVEFGFVQDRDDPFRLRLAPHLPDECQENLFLPRASPSFSLSAAYCPNVYMTASASSM